MKKNDLVSFKEKYEGEWLLLDDVETDDIQQPVKGVLLAHSKSKAEIYEKLLQVRPKQFAIEYAGEIPKDYVVMF
ncbi:MAG: hypothetical protein QME81_13380 [bacterium]|nr:hypothetical protein [bacterium]